MQLKLNNTQRTTFASPFFGGLNLLKQILICGVLILSFNASAKEATGFETKESDEFSFRGLNYGVIESRLTNRLWLDRNLGAAQICTTLRDDACYGDLYQWGRNADGHQLRTSSTMTKKSEKISTETGEFYTKSNRTLNDWVEGDEKGEAREKAWENGGVNDICPKGYSVPTIKELKALFNDLGIENRHAAFLNRLSIPAAGFRYTNGDIRRPGGSANLWSRTASPALHGVNTQAYYMYITRAHAAIEKDDRSRGYSVRCIQNKNHK